MRPDINICKGEQSERDRRRRGSGCGCEDAEEGFIAVDCICLRRLTREDGRGDR